MCIKLDKEIPDSIDWIIEGKDEMRFRSQQNDILDFLGNRIDLHYISYKGSERITLISDKEEILLDGHSDDLVVECRIIEISSQKEKN